MLLEESGKLELTRWFGRQRRSRSSKGGDERVPGSRDLGGPYCGHSRRVDRDMTYVLSAGVSVHRDADATLTVRRGTGAVSVSGRAAALTGRILCATEEPRSVSEVAEECCASFSEVAGILSRLEAQGLVTDVSALDCQPGVDRAANTYLSLFSASTDCDIAGSTSPQVVWDGDGELAEPFCASASESIDVRLTDVATFEGECARAANSRRASLLVSLRHQRDDAHLRRLGLLSRRAGVPYLAGWFEDASIILTHLMEPFRTACYECLCARERAAAYGRIESAWDALDEPAIAIGPIGRLAASDSVLASFAALRSIHFFVGVPCEAPAPALLQVDCATLRVSHHPVLRVPMCEGCSDAS